MKGIGKVTCAELALLIILSAAHHASSQTQILSGTEGARLVALSRALDQESNTARQIAIQKATQENWPIHKEFPGGKVIGLQRLDSGGMPMYYRTHNLNAAKTVSTNRVWPGGSSGLNLTGSGMRVGEWDAGEPLITHQELSGRVSFQMGEFFYNDHSTHVAGTLIATGVDASAKGMAFQARLNGWDWTNDISEMAEAAASGLLLSNHSYGYIRGWEYDYRGDSRWAWFGDVSINQTEDYRFGFYDDVARNVDSVSVLAPYYQVVVSAGNDRDDTGPAPGVQYWVYQGGGWVLSTTPRNTDGNYDCISHHGIAKNSLTVGAVNDIPAGYASPSDVVMTTFSSWGPTDDGRIKPDIVANGMSLYSCISTGNAAYYNFSGTSMAAPNVTGSLLLLQQHYKNLHGGDTMRAATLKGLVIHTADEAGIADGPDYSFGWGLLNTSKAASVVSSAPIGNCIKQVRLSNGGVYSIEVQPTGVAPLVATICWTDPPGTPPAPSVNPRNRMLVNDLDLRIIGNGSTYYPWVLDPDNVTQPATTGDDSLNNVEKVRVLVPSGGPYIVQVTHKRTLQGGGQDFALIVSGATRLSDVGLPISTAADTQQHAHAASIATWGAAYVVWEHRSAGYFDIYGQLVNVAGAPEWTANGIPICNASYDQVNARPIALGSIGTIVTWEDYRNQNLVQYFSDIYVQRLNASGTPQWTGNGNAVCSRTGHQLNPHIAGTPSASVFVAWEDDRNGNWDIYAQRVNDNGYVPDQNGIPICTSSGSQLQPQVVGDDSNNAIIVWADQRNSAFGDIYAQKLRYNRTVTWAADGVVVSTMGYQSSPLIVTDGTGGAIIIWEHTLGGASENIYAQRINGSGVVQWSTNGISVHGAGAIDMVKMISDGAGGAIVTWRDQSPLAPASIGAQRISPGGTLLWGASGVEICSGSGPSPTNPCLASDGSGGAIITWQDARLGSSNVDIYAQKVNSAGTLQWTTNGITISTAAGNQVEPCIATHGVGDVLAVWTDTRNGSTPDIYAQHFTAGGALPIQLASFTAHYIASCGSVLLEWTTVTELNNFGFRIQRRIASSSEFETLPNVFIPGHGTTTELHHYSFTDSTVSPAGWWYRLNQIDLDGTSHYSDPVPVEIPTNVEGSDMPKQFWLSQNHPNPFNPTTTIEFSIAKRTHVRIAVYDILGREVSTLIDETKDTGTHRVTWDASDASSGVYFYTIQSREFVATRKMLVLK